MNVQEWPGGIVQVKVPLPFSLKWVNSYLIADADGYTLIDPGLHTAEAVHVWEEVLERRQIAFSQIRTILLTHQHPDHYGLAGWFQQRCGAPVHISADSYAYAVRLWGEGRTFAGELTALYEQHGMPRQLLAQIAPHLESFVERVSPQPEVTLLEAGTTIRFGGLTWSLLDAPGHAKGQLCLYTPEKQWMFCGDQVLPEITPNISVVPGEDEDPLQSFLDSLQMLREIEVRLAFPGHREPFADFGGRIDRILAHHVRRLTAIVEMLKERPLTGFEVCQHMFGERIAGNIHNLRFAMSEALAHLYHLQRKGRIGHQCRTGLVSYFSEN
ncbi:MBL fold metallo-hydrolase [Paenibacillus sp. GCM10027626]|uniref:MBL fold metallo-hydrolase n=1 Tax=Paenibacillus sp. GCM10027626 TaxID=3273411 RepID=UPI00362DC676